MGALHVVLGLYATTLPFAILAGWMAVSLWDLAGRDDVGRGARAVWALVVLVVPVIGPVAYLVATPRLPSWLTAAFVGGGLLAYLLVLLVTAAVGGAG